MKKTRKLMSMLLLAALVLSIGMFGIRQTAQAEAAAVTVDGGDINAQLSLIYANLEAMKQPSTQMKWYYTVTDLDHDGRLEFVAAAQHPADRSTNLKVWEVSEDRTALTELTLNKDPEESFPDIMTDNTDTYHDPATNTWYYMCYDNIVISPLEVYTVKSAVNIKDGTIGYDSFAIEHTEVQNGYRNVSHSDPSGIPLSPEQYNVAGSNAFAGMERSSTSFDWFTEEKVGHLSRLTDSYMVFAGEKEQTEVFPVPKPEALQHTAAPSPMPSPTPTPKPQNQKQTQVYLNITKNPTNESNRKVGGKATFVACANVFESLSWTFISPDGGEYSVASFNSLFPRASISGEYSTTITVNNLDAGMNNWGAYCTFYYKGQVASTSAAWIYIKDAPAPSPKPPVTPTPSAKESGIFSGYVTDYNYSTVSIWVDDGYGWDAVVGKDICSVSGELYVGAPLTAYYDGIAAHGPIFTYVEIRGSEPKPEPVYASTSGTAHEGGGGYAINLINGSQVYVDAWICNVSGRFVDGSPCTVYYIDTPSADNIYRVDIYGDETPADDTDYDKIDWDISFEPFISIPDEDYDGGWAGSNYYDNEADYDDGGWAGSNYYDNEADYDGGGWAGSNYYDNESDYDDGLVEEDYDFTDDDGGWAGSYYEDDDFFDEGNG